MAPPSDWPDGPNVKGNAMKRTIILTLAAAALAGCDGDLAERFPPGPFGTTDLAPNTSLASTAPYAPTQRERDTFDDLFTRQATKQEVLRFMGHPMEIYVLDVDGLERWKYPWGDSCIVVFAGDRVFKNVYKGPVR